MNTLKCTIGWTEIKLKRINTISNEIVSAEFAK